MKKLYYTFRQKFQIPQKTFKGEFDSIQEAENSIVAYQNDNIKNAKVIKHKDDSITYKFNEDEYELI